MPNMTLSLPHDLCRCMIVAAVAMNRELTLVARDKHFERIKEEFENFKLSRGPSFPEEQAHQEGDERAQDNGFLEGAL